MNRVYLIVKKQLKKWLELLTLHLLLFFDSYSYTTPFLTKTISYFLNFNYDEVEVLFLTAREDTEDGLIKYNTEKFIRNSFPLLQQQDFKLFMRPENDFRPSHQVKEQILTEEILPIYDVIMAFDDDRNNIKMFINNGITALEVHSKDYYNFLKEDRG